MSAKPDSPHSSALSFSTQAGLAEWLKNHHDSQPELWIKVYKKGSRIVSINWAEIVTEVLCWGWIDGVKKSLGAEAYLQRITPRTNNSSWSKRNTEHVERLIAEGKMMAPGLVQVEAAKADGRWEAAYAPASEMPFPEDFLGALQKNPNALQFFETLGKSSRYVIAYALSTAKKPETRDRRFQKYLAMIERGEKPSFF